MKLNIDHGHERRFSEQIEIVKVTLGVVEVEHRFDTPQEVDAYRKGLQDAERMLGREHEAELEELRAAMMQMVERARGEDSGITPSAGRVLASIVTAMRGMDIEKTLGTRAAQPAAGSEDVPQR